MKKNFTKQFNVKFNLNNQKEADVYHFIATLDRETFFRIIEGSPMYKDNSKDLFNIVDRINTSNRQSEFETNH